MIRISLRQTVPELEYVEYSANEFAKAKPMLKEIEKASEGIWLLSNDANPLMVVGVIRQSFLSRPRLWFLLCRDFTCANVNYNLRGLKAMLQELDKRYPVTETLVEDGWERGFRFARFCGFVPFEQQVTVFGTTYRVMRRG